MKKKRIAVLGSTGSVGTQTLEVCRALGFTVTGLAAYANVTLLEEQIRAFRPSRVVVIDPEACGRLAAAVADLPVTVQCGADALCTLAACNDHNIVVNAVVGMVGLRPTLAAVEAGHDVALANKETLVAGGSLVMDAARKRGVRIVPVDSEHSAIFQCLAGNEGNRIGKLLLTASGGAFRGWSRERLEKATLQDALSNPNWVMGAKVTIDSASLMNKGLELIEAMWLFGVAPEQVEIVVHPQSIIHSMVEFEDGAVMAQLGAPDMRLPIQYALTFPGRVSGPAKRLSITDCGPLTFEKPDIETFRCLASCIRAAALGGTAPAVVNAANETAVSRFMSGAISFLQIGEIVEAALNNHNAQPYHTMEEILAADDWARSFAGRYL